LPTRGPKPKTQKSLDNFVPMDNSSSWNFHINLTEVVLLAMRLAMEYIISTIGVHQATHIVALYDCKLLTNYHEL
jgi:hypothetical protein